MKIGFHGDNETWIETFTGRQFWPLDPRSEDIDIRDIAHALSMVCRFTGHVREFYSVGQHSVHVAEILLPFGKNLGLVGLLHDASEAYIADIARPVKHCLKHYLEIEQRLEKCIAERFGLIFPYPTCLKAADNMMLNSERRDLMPPSERPYTTYDDGCRNTIVESWQPKVTEETFLALFERLTCE